ncbi:MAG: leucine-rich repeat domain-containing protein [Verrucomicrobia bacterium]|nr:leucine-rich repeat domain-containing protein [Verrucomicrobiota bacterium]
MHSATNLRGVISSCASSLASHAAHSLEMLRFEEEEEHGEEEVCPQAATTIDRLSDGDLYRIFSFATGSLSPDGVQTFCQIRGVCQRWNSVASNGVLEDYWTEVKKLLFFTDIIDKIDQKWEASNLRKLCGIWKRELSHRNLEPQDLTKWHAKITKQSPYVIRPSEQMKQEIEEVCAEQADAAVPLGDFWRFERLSKALGSPRLLISPQDYEKHLNDSSLEKLWERVKGRIFFGSGRAPNNKADEIRSWLNNPDNAWRLDSITSIDLEGLDLRVLPPEIGKFSHLRCLLLRNNKLRSLPDEICDLGELTALRLGHNELQRLPERFGNFLRLERLELSCNQLEFLPNSFCDLGQLTVLELSTNKLQRLPEHFGNYPHLKELVLSYNQLKVLPDSFCYLRNLCYLDIMDNQLEVLPGEFGNLNGLVSLNLSVNQLQTLPVTICNLVSLEIMDIMHNELNHLPDEVGGLSELRYLGLNQNQLRVLPATIGNLRQLKDLTVEENRLEELPATIGNLSLLRTFHFSQNQLTTIPEAVFNLIAANMPDLYSSGNPLVFTLNEDLTGYEIGRRSFCERYLACKDYKTRTPLAAIYQSVHCQEDKAAIQEKFAQLSQEVQGRIEAYLGVSIEQASMVKRGAFAMALIEVLKERLCNLSAPEKMLLYDQVLELAGLPRGGDEWWQEHATDNIVRWIDAIELTISAIHASSSRGG